MAPSATSTWAKLAAARRKYYFAVLIGKRWPAKDSSAVPGPHQTCWT